MTKRKASLPPLTDEEEARIQAGIANDPDNPEITDEQARQLRPFAEALPELHAAWKRGPGRPKAAATKVPVKLRLDPETLAAFKATGAGWQTRMNGALTAAAAGLSPTPEPEPESEAADDKPVKKKRGRTRTYGAKTRGKKVKQVARRRKAA